MRSPYMDFNTRQVRKLNEFIEFQFLGYPLALITIWSPTPKFTHQYSTITTGNIVPIASYIYSPAVGMQHNRWGPHRVHHSEWVRPPKSGIYGTQSHSFCGIASWCVTLPVWYLRNDIMLGIERWSRNREHYPSLYVQLVIFNVMHSNNITGVLRHCDRWSCSVHGTLCAHTAEER